MRIHLYVLENQVQGFRGADFNFMVLAFLRHTRIKFGYGLTTGYRSKVWILGSDVSAAPYLGPVDRHDMETSPLGIASLQ